MKRLNPFLIILILICSSCLNAKVITGVITEIRNDTVTVDKVFKFKVYPHDSLWLGKEVSFEKTVNRSKINSKKLR